MSAHPDDVRHPYGTRLRRRKSAETPSPGGAGFQDGGPCHPDNLPRGSTTRPLMGRAHNVRCGVRRGLPTSDRAVGLRQVDGMALWARPWNAERRIRQPQRSQRAGLQVLRHGWVTAVLGHQKGGIRGSTGPYRATRRGSSTSRDSNPTRLTPAHPGRAFGTKRSLTRVALPSWARESQGRRLRRRDDRTCPRAHRHQPCRHARARPA